MKQFKIFHLIALVLAVTTALAFSPPPTPYGKHSGTLGCVSGTIVGSDNCAIQSGSQCQVIVGPPGSQETVDAFGSLSGCQNMTDRLRRPTNP